MSLEPHTRDCSLYGTTMVSFRSGHSVGNTMRMLKLPLIFLSQELYAGPIAQFYVLSRALEVARR